MRSCQYTVTLGIGVFPTLNPFELYITFIFLGKTKVKLNKDNNKNMLLSEYDSAYLPIKVKTDGLVRLCGKGS